VDGVNPQGLIIDSAGNLYGTTQSGGFFGAGEVYELQRTSTGLVEKALFSFNQKGKGGYFPGPENLLRDASGDFYGTTQEGGTLANGTVYKLAPKAGGGFIETVLYPTNNRATGVIMDGSGNLYGEMPYAGSGSGAVFELSPASGGTWTEQTLYTFCSTGSCGTDGKVPTGGLIFDASGNLYGTTYYGGAYGTSGQGYGTLFKLTQSAGTWTEGTVYSFGNGADGANPQGGLLLNAGSLYGITQNGGTGFGTVFEVTP
jgi:hypothetical protein